MSDRKEHWEKIYSDKSPLEVSWYQKRPEVSLALIGNTGITPDAPIIDVGGGASTLVDCLLEAGYTNIGVLDLSSKALAYARDRLGAKGDEVDWYVDDVTRFRPPRPFALWHDRAVFHFLTEKADREAYVEVLKSSLRPGGHLVLAAFAPGGPEQCSGLDIVQYDAEKLMAELGAEFELVEEKGEMHLTPGDKEQKFGYFRFVRHPEEQENGH